MEPFAQGFLCGMGAGAFGLVLFVMVLGWIGAPARGPVVGRRPDDDGTEDLDDERERREVDRIARRQAELQDRTRTQWD